MNTIYVATPMYGGQCYGMYMTSIMNLMWRVHEHRSRMIYGALLNESLITRARNKLANNFLLTREATHLMFIDADIYFEANDVINMLSVDEDIICGIYPKKSIDWVRVHKAALSGVGPDDLKSFSDMPVIEGDGNPVDERGLKEVQACGTGFMLIKRKVLEAMADKVPTYLDMYPSTEPIHEFFSTSIDEATNDLLSEDYHFCKLARLNGFKVMADCRANLGHVGTFNFWGRSQIEQVNNG